MFHIMLPSYRSIRTIRRSLIRLVLVASILTIAEADSEYREMKSADGKSITAKVLDFSEIEGVTIETASGQTFKNVPSSRFSIEDRKYYKEWLLAQKEALENANLELDSALRIVVTTSRDRELNDDGDPDNIVVEYEPKVVIHNDERQLSFKNVKGVLILIGQSVLDRGEYHILYREEFTINLPVNQKSEWAGPHFTNTYDDNASNGSSFGAKYEGYLMVLHDENERPTIMKSTNKLRERSFANILKATIEKGYSRDFSESFNKTVF